jgi:hypothetical protein
MLRTLILCALSIPAQAAIVGTVDSGEGSRMDFHDGPGELCKAPARMAVYTDAKGEAVVGCWVLRAGAVRVNWLDGDRDNVPVGHIKRPEGV